MVRVRLSVTFSKRLYLKILICKAICKDFILNSRVYQVNMCLKTNIGSITDFSQHVCLNFHVYTCIKEARSCPDVSQETQHGVFKLSKESDLQVIAANKIVSPRCTSMPYIGLKHALMKEIHVLTNMYFQLKHEIW